MGKKLMQKNLKESLFFPDFVNLNILELEMYVKGLVLYYAFYFSGLLQFNKLTRFLEENYVKGLVYAAMHSVIKSVPFFAKDAKT